MKLQRKKILKGKLKAIIIGTTLTVLMVGGVIGGIKGTHVIDEKIDNKYISAALLDFLDFYQQEFEYSLEDVARYFNDNHTIFDV